MEAREARVRASDGVSLHARSRRPRRPARATLLVVHGVGEHGDRYEAFAGRLAGAGIATWVYDLRGHGRSGGARVHVDRWARYERDLEDVARHAMAGDSRWPLFVFGHSLGALICLTAAMRGFGGRVERFGGWILSGAGLRPSGLAKPWLVRTARALSRVAPRFSLDLGIAPESLSHEPDVVRAYREDPGIHRRATVRWGAEALEAVRSIEAGAHGIRDPMLILHGGDDPLAEAEGSRWLARTVSGPVELIVYEGALHEPHNEPGYADVVEDILRWIDLRLRA